MRYLPGSIKATVAAKAMSTVEEADDEGSREHSKLESMGHEQEKLRDGKVEISGLKKVSDLNVSAHEMKQTASWLFQIHLVKKIWHYLA